MAHHFVATFTEADHPTLHAVTGVAFRAKHHLHAIEAGRLETFITERDLFRIRCIHRQNYMSRNCTFDSWSSNQNRIDGNPQHRSALDTHCMILFALHNAPLPNVILSQTPLHISVYCHPPPIHIGK